MSTQPKGETGHADQHEGQHHVVTQPAPMNQQRIGGLIDQEAAGRDNKEAPQRSADGDALAAESPAAMAAIRKPEGHQPAEHVGHRRAPVGEADQGHDHAPVHQRSQAADGDEPVQAAAAIGLQGHKRWAHGQTDDSPKRSICIAVDDYGLHPGINQAALLLAEAGRAQAIGCMVGGSAWASWCRALMDVNHRAPAVRRIDLGLHLDLTETAAATFGARPLWQLMVECWSRCIDRRPLRAEIRRQLDVFEQTLGRAPDYVDGHQHVHQFPVVRSELMSELQGRYGSRSTRPWLRSTRQAASSQRRFVGGLKDGLKASLIETLGAHALALAAQRGGFLQNRALLGVYDFRADAAAYAAHLRVWLRQAETADLLMCHPSLPSDGGDPLRGARVAEFEVLSSAALGSWLTAEGVVLRPLSWILASAGVSARG